LTDHHEHDGEHEFVPSSVRKYREHYQIPRVFVRAVQSERYSIHSSIHPFIHSTYGGALLQDGSPLGKQLC
jgi:hypothetical protein